MTNMERTFTMVKPDGVKTRHIGDIISRIERTGLRIVAMRMMQPNKEFVEKFYPNDNDWFTSIGERTKKAFKDQNLDVKKCFGTEDAIEMGKIVKKWLVNYIASGPVVGMAVEGNKAISIIRKFCGATYPDQAVPGTIRGDFSTDSPDLANTEGRAVQNVIHASGNEKEAKNEIGLWFKEEEIAKFGEMK
jgi:nucleoside-diphosphate kinase